MERLQKILSQAGIASRRASEQLMLEGRVTVNGATVRELGTKADASRDDIRVDGRRVKVAEHHRYLLLNKPRGYVTTRSDPRAPADGLDLLAACSEYVYPVGRLDFESEGLLLLTNDGDLAARLTHPSHGVRACTRRACSACPTRTISTGSRAALVIDGPADGAGRRQAAAARRDARTGHAGRSRFARGATARCERCATRSAIRSTHLRRVAIGPIQRSRLKPGQWRELTDDGSRAAQKAAARATPRPTRSRSTSQRTPRTRRKTYVPDLVSISVLVR